MFMNSTLSSNQTHVDRSVDVLLVGAGPIGLELAVNLKQASVNYLHLEAEQIGYTMSWYPRQARFFSSPDRIAIAGVPLQTVDQSKATREEYLSYLVGVVQQFQLAIQTYERVTSIEKSSVGGFYVRSKTISGEQRHYHAQKVILAIGDMHEPRPLQHPSMGLVPGCDLPHVSAYFHEPHRYAFRQLMIVGGKNSAVEAALRCHRVGAEVSLCFRQPALSDSIKYWLKPEMDGLLASGAIRGYPGCVPVEITPREVILARVNEKGEPTSQREYVPADFVLLLIGYQMDSRLLAAAGVELQGPSRTPVVNPETMETNVPGLYMAGTATAGSQIQYRLFIENCHSHVIRIMRHLGSGDPKHLNRLGYTGISSHPLTAES